MPDGSGKVSKVVDKFLGSYYKTFSETPDKLYNFYLEESHVIREGLGARIAVTGREAIEKEFSSYSSLYRGDPKLSSTRSSVGGSCRVQVTSHCGRFGGQGMEFKCKPTQSTHGD